MFTHGITVITLLTHFPETYLEGKSVIMVWVFLMTLTCSPFVVQQVITSIWVENSTWPIALRDIIISELSRRSLIDQFRTMPYAFYFKAFVDMGYAGDPISSTTNNYFNKELMYSAGLGLDIVTYYDFVVRFEFSVNRQKQTGFFVNFRSAL